MSSQGAALNEDQALDAEFMRLKHSPSTTLDMQLIKTFYNLLVWCDIVGPLPYSQGLKYLLTCVDLIARWPEAILLVDIKSETVAAAFFSGWIARFRTPATITTDRGAQFESRLWAICLPSMALSEIVQRATTLSRMTWLNIPPSAKGRPYGTRITELVANYVVSSIICLKRTFRKISSRDGLRHDTQVTWWFYRDLYS